MVKRGAGMIFYPSANPMPAYEPIYTVREVCAVNHFLVILLNKRKRGLSGMRRPVTGSRLQPRKPWESRITNACMSRPVGRLSRYRSVLTAVIQTRY